jgi:hypothetical protein
LAWHSTGAKVRDEMSAAVSVKADGLPNVCQRKVVKTNPKGAKTECLFADGISILLSNFLASFVRAGDELLFPLAHEAADGGTQIYLRKTHAVERRWDVFQAEIGYATQPRRDKRNNLFVSAEVPDSQLGISAINLRCEALRDYFYVGNRRRRRDGSTFYASRILSFLPVRKFKHFRAPLRRVAFYNDRAVYRDSRRKLEILFDQTSLPLLWDSSWNQWKHLLGTKIGVKATFVQSGQYYHHADAWNLAQWETAVPSRIEVTLPSSIVEQVAEARKTHHRFGEFSEALDLIRARIESAPVERTDLQKLCAELGIPADFDISLITWKPDYDPFYYKQLSKRARRLYLFQSEYIFDLERSVIVETPLLGHATYLFSKPVNMTEFLALYGRVAKDDIRRNRGNLAERLGFLGRLIHGLSPQRWLKELKNYLGEAVDCAEFSN